MHLDDIKNYKSLSFSYLTPFYFFFLGFDLVESFEEFDQYSKKLARKQIQKTLQFFFFGVMVIYDFE